MKQPLTLTTMTYCDSVSSTIANVVWWVKINHGGLAKVGSKMVAAGGKAGCLRPTISPWGGSGTDMLSATKKSISHPHTIFNLTWVRKCFTVNVRVTYEKV